MGTKDEAGLLLLVFCMHLLSTLFLLIKAVIVFSLQICPFRPWLHPQSILPESCVSSLSFPTVVSKFHCVLTVVCSVTSFSLSVDDNTYLFRKIENSRCENSVSFLPVPDLFIPSFFVLTVVGRSPSYLSSVSPPAPPFSPFTHPPPTPMSSASPVIDKTVLHTKQILS